MIATQLSGEMLRTENGRWALTVCVRAAARHHFHLSNAVNLCTSTNVLNFVILQDVANVL